MDTDVALREFLQYTFGMLLAQPEEAVIRSEHRDNGSVAFNVGLSDDDVGRVIGRSGHTIASIRSLLQAGAERNGVKASLQVASNSGVDSSSE